MEYGPYWQQIGLDTSERLDDFHDVPVLWLSGWYDIYARSTVDFFCHLVDRKKGPHVLIMGPWQHVGPEDHVVSCSSSSSSNARTLGRSNERRSVADRLLARVYAFLSLLGR